MTPLLAQFIQEGRDALQEIGENLMALEKSPDSVELMTVLFRLVHTLKGNSGLFEFPEMTRVLHTGEDLMDAVRDGRVAYSQQLADSLLDAMDFVGILLDEIEHTGLISAKHAAPSLVLAQALRVLIPVKEQEGVVLVQASPASSQLLALGHIPEAARIRAWRETAHGNSVYWLNYRPEEECFFKGEDPFHQVRQINGLVWGEPVPRGTWPKLAELDCYRCLTDFHLLVCAEFADLEEFFRYMPEQVSIVQVDPLALMAPDGHPNGGPVYGDFVAEALSLLEANDLAGLEAAARSMLELSSPALWLSSDLRWLLEALDAPKVNNEVLRRLINALSTLTPPDWTNMQADELPSPEFASSLIAPSGINTPAVLPVAANLPTADDLDKLEAILNIQAEILGLPDTVDWLSGRLKSVANTLISCLAGLGESSDEIEDRLEAALDAKSAQPLRDWLNAFRTGDEVPVAQARADIALAINTPPAVQPAAISDSEAVFGRRTDDGQLGKVIKVDQVKIDLLMNLIGEMVVAKNGLPYLANRAETQYGVRELSREIKSQYAVINRIAEEMQDAIMQVRMMPVSFVLQRFPRLVRDTSRKLGKEVLLILEGEDTEADKNIVEALADPLIHIVRNSLDHGLESPEERAAAGKPRAGKLTIRALQEADRVVIEIIDDGRGINPAIIKRKAYEKGLIDEATLEKISDQEAINLVFAAGFSTAEVVSDLSGRGVGMDVVRNAIDKVGGTVTISSELGLGTKLQLSLPLSMAVTNVMIIESNGQIFGVPMEMVVETVRLPRAEIRSIKNKQVAVLRGSIVPLMSLNELLAISQMPLANADDEFAALVVRVRGEQIGLMVDDFREVVDVILKPLPGELGKLSSYAGTALLGDGSVLMVLNPKGLF